MSSSDFRLRLFASENKIDEKTVDSFIAKYPSKDSHDSHESKVSKDSKNSHESKAKRVLSDGQKAYQGFCAMERKINPSISMSEIAVAWAKVKESPKFNQKDYIEAYIPKHKGEKKERVASPTAYQGFMHSMKEKIPDNKERIAEWNKIKESLSDSKKEELKKIAATNKESKNKKKSSSSSDSD
jgi:hypothetical protein